ncbi:MAG: ubiquitin family protein [Mycobacteriales bacterium]
MSRVSLRYWAAARAAAGVCEEEFQADTLESALVEAVRRHGPALARVLTVASFLVDGQPVGTRDPAVVLIPEHAIVEVLPPFAGGSEGAENAPPPGVAG